MDDRFKALADPNRLAILAFLAEPTPSCCTQDDGVCACDFESLLDLSQPTISHHLKILVNAGFVAAEKRGRWMYYDLQPEAFAEAIAFLEAFRDARSPAPFPGSSGPVAAGGEPEGAAA